MSKNRLTIIILKRKKVVILITEYSIVYKLTNTFFLKQKMKIQNQFPYRLQYFSKMISNSDYMDVAKKIF